MNGILRFAGNIFPSIRWSRDYNLNSFFQDMTAGASLAGILIPQAMSYALLAMLPPICGLYATVLSALAHLIFGLNPFQSIGPFALVSLLSGDASLSTAIALNGTESVSRESNTPWESYPLLLPVSDLLSLTVSLFLFLMLLTGIGRRIKSIVPNILIKGFTGAASISIVTSQVKFVFGIGIAPITGTFIIIRTWISILEAINQFNFVAFFVSISTILLIQMMEYVETRWSFIKDKLNAIFRPRQYILLGSSIDSAENISRNSNISDQRISTTDKKGFTIPKILISLIIMTCISYSCKIGEKYSVALVGKIPSGLPDYNSPIRIFNLIHDPLLISTMVSNIVLNSLAISLVAYITLLSVVQTFPSKPNNPISARGLSIPLNFNRISPSERIPSNLEDSTEYQSGILSSVNHIADLERDSVIEQVEGLPTNNDQIQVLTHSIQVNDESHCFLKDWEEEDNEILAISAASFLCSCFSGFVAASSLSRSAILATQTNAKSPMANAIASIFVIITVFFLTDLIYYVPLNCLAAVIISSLKSTIKRIGEIKDLWKNLKEKNGWKQWYDLSLFVGTFSAVVIFDPCTGIIIGMMIALIWNIFRMYYKVTF